MQYITLFFALWVVWAKQLSMFNSWPLLIRIIVVIYSVIRLVATRSDPNRLIETCVQQESQTHFNPIKKIIL